MLSHGFPFDAVQMPLNCFDAAVPELRAARAARSDPAAASPPIGMKSLGGDARSVTSRTVTPADAIGYSLSLPIATLVSRDRLDESAEPERCGGAPASGRSRARAMQALRRKVAERAADGRFELYKIGITFDGPESRRQHGLPLTVAD